jgi:hypothetical protein
MDEQIEYKTSENKQDWFSNHVLTKEQVAQLIQNKIDRARIYQKANEKVNKLTYND